MADATLVPPFPFSKGVPLLKVPSTPKSPVYFGHGAGAQKDTNTVLFDLGADPRQLAPVGDRGVEARLMAEMARLMASVNAPPESFERLGLTARATA